MSFEAEGKLEELLGVAWTINQRMGGIASTGAKQASLQSSLEPTNPELLNSGAGVACPVGETEPLCPFTK
jgi:hypothetical protein